MFRLLGSTGAVVRNNIQNATSKVCFTLKAAVDATKSQRFVKLAPLSRPSRTGLPRAASIAPGHSTNRNNTLVAYFPIENLIQVPRYHRFISFAQDEVLAEAIKI
jgi:hypothetical protein